MKFVKKPLKLSKHLLRTIVFKPPILDKNKKISIKVYSKNSPIFSHIADSNSLIYNGNAFKQIKIHPQMLKFKLGEFIFTRKMTKNIHERTKK